MTFLKYISCYTWWWYSVEHASEWAFPLYSIHHHTLDSSTFQKCARQNTRIFLLTWHRFKNNAVFSFRLPPPIWKWMIQRTVFERIAHLTGQCPIWRRDAPSWMQQKDWHSSWSLAHLVKWVDCFVTIRLGTLKAKFLRTECTSFLISIYLVFVVAIL